MKTAPWEKYIWPILALLAIMLGFLFALNTRYDTRLITTSLGIEKTQVFDKWTRQAFYPL
ncbi:hypothetical protein A3K24_02050 [candidate division Kazan bacterium RIFCSPHIGHO2_01_FULL_44_14]|uniref:Uncharacterized protein n=1 Tax=candidate division Kazan bacterium RIFCSPLOWO2_01_FULL_45_19 TaxID=1798538 RepID=A0A1F4NQP8_UNCK3|nr:MAG: hypothetical protein A3K51_02050 [candidate division Kazan bacterium RIFCSPLOWO2_01_FULL_45_19]OGB77853.1 MAG: hypothetical protein A3K24_02050 [candidate division Kazan bacterium RIFCSPHIGHO2_01_FULL_44_14]